MSRRLPRPPRVWMAGEEELGCLHLSAVVSRGGASGIWRRLRLLPACLPPTRLTKNWWCLCGRGRRRRRKRRKESQRSLSPTDVGKRSGPEALC